MEKIFFVLIIILIIEKTYEIKCTTNFDCVDTGCCHNNKCDKLSECQKVNKLCYGLVGAAGFIIIALTIIYFWWKIKKTRKFVLELKKLDDKIYSKRKGSNIELLRKFKNKQFS